METAVVGHIYPTRAATFGRDKDNTVGGIGTIQGGCRGTSQGADALNIVRIDVTGGITRLSRTCKDAFGLLAGEVLHGNAVHDIEHIVVAVDGLGTAHHHAAAAARTCCAGIDGHTGHLARKRVDKVGILYLHQRVAAHLLHVIGQRFGFLLDA